MADAAGTGTGTEEEAPLPQAVAIVDDDVRIRTLLRLELEDLGARVACFRSGSEALDGMNHASPDLVLLDVGLPDMDGLTCLRRLRQQGLRARVVLMSGHWNPMGSEQLEAAGAESFVVKTALPALLASLMQPPG